MLRYFLLIPFFSVCLFSCTDKYLAYKSNYSFKTETNAPDYNSLDFWAAHPWKKDPADSIPSPLLNEQRDTLVDVFFLHPTTFTDKDEKDKWNAAIDDNYLNAKTDYSTILYQASAFNQHARVFAPRYRQAHINAFYDADKKRAAEAFELAYQDLKTAFEFYLQHYNNGRPIIIAAHSQGTYLGLRLLKEFFDGKDLQKQLVAAYMIGWPIDKNYFTSLKICEDPAQTDCLCGWRTYREGFTPPYNNNENGNTVVTNPLSWKTDGEKISRKENEGAILKDFNKIVKATTGGRIYNGMLWTNRPKFPGSFLYRSKNYHIGDINLFYINIRKNVEQRIGDYFKK